MVGIGLPRESGRFIWQAVPLSQILFREIAQNSQLSIVLLWKSADGGSSDYIGVVAGADAHGVVPGDGEGPKDEGAEDGLAEDERKNVVVAGEEPAHGGAAEECEGNQDRVGPVQCGEKQAADDGCDVGAWECAEQAVHRHGLQGELLQRAKSEIADEAARLDEVRGQTMQCAERDAYANQGDDKGKKNRSGEFRRSPEIVCAPAERFRSFMMQNKAEQEPDGEDQPSVRAGVLAAPNVEGDDGRKCQRFEQIEKRGDETARHNLVQSPKR